MNIAIIDDQDDIKYAVEKILKKEGHTCYGFDGHEEDLIDGLNVFNIELIILDMMLANSKTGLDVLEHIRANLITTPVVMITAYTSPQNMIKASKSGIIDIIQKPFKSKDIIEIVQKYTTTQTNNAILDVDKNNEFIGSFETMKEIYKSIGIAANSDSNILIIGQTGSGKNLVAKLIHQNSKRANEPFISIDCSTIPENLFEKIMFGKDDTFFKNADANHIGHVQKVGSGTLFIDEISELSQVLQIKLLHFLETKSFYSLGSPTEIEFKGRIICASLEKQNSELETNNLRKDLYYRISTYEIFLPNLKDRKNDIHDLVIHFAKLFCKELKLKNKKVDDNAIEYIKNCSLKGNVRELKNIINKAILNSRNEHITLEEIQSIVDANQKDKNATLKSFCEELINIYTFDNAKLIFDDFEKEMLIALMQRSNNITKLSNNLGITRNTLKSKLQKYQIFPLK